MTYQKSRLSADVFSNRVIERNPKLGFDACQILANAIRAVDPYDCVYSQVKLDHQQLMIGNKAKPVDQYNRIFAIGFGKAAVPMAKALIDRLDERLHSARVITKDPKYLDENGYRNKLTVYLGGHPIPTKESIHSTRAVLLGLPELSENDLVLVVISGGGSALFTEPVPGVTLEDMQCLTHLLLKSGADIHEINTLRKHLDQVKGGRLAMRLQPAHVESIILSDVIGDRLDMIASGPTVADPTTFEDALKILTNYHLKNQVPKGIFLSLDHGREGLIPETLKLDQLPVGKVDHHLVGTNFLATQAARQTAEVLGYHALIISAALTGRTDYIAEFLAGILQTEIIYEEPCKKPACLIFGGEPTVNVKGDGLGGRNMDLALRMVPRLMDKPNTLFISFATDGEDGPTDAAGAAVDALVLSDRKNLQGLRIDSYIENNDSYHYMDKVGGLIKTGSTGTNVNDLVIMLIDKENR